MAQGKDQQNQGNQGSGQQSDRGSSPQQDRGQAGQGQQDRSQQDQGQGSQANRDKMREQGGQASQGSDSRQPSMDDTDEDLPADPSLRGGKGGNQGGKS